MIGYWNKTKTVYYRRIKCELNLEKDQSVFTHSNIEATVGRESADGVDFELPSQLASFETTFLHDPDATLRHLLTSLACKQSYKEETREASRIGEFQ